MSVLKTFTNILTYIFIGYTFHPTVRPISKCRHVSEFKQCKKIVVIRSLDKERITVLQENAVMSFKILGTLYTALLRHMYFDFALQDLQSVSSLMLFSRSPKPQSLNSQQLLVNMSMEMFIRIQSIIKNYDWLIMKILMRAAERLLKILRKKTTETRIRLLVSKKELQTNF